MWELVYVNLKKQDGGLTPLAIAVLASLAGTALGKVWDLVTQKMEEKGYTIDHALFNTDAHKRLFLKHVLH